MTVPAQTIDAEDLIGDLLARVEPAIEGASRLLTRGLPADLASAIFDGMRAQARRLRDRPPQASRRSAPGR